jgi:molybdopterin synthase sulfur carrier subunit
VPKRREPCKNRAKLNLPRGFLHPFGMAKIHIPTPLRQYAGKQPALDVAGETVGEALGDLVAQHPDLRRHLYTEEGKLRSFVNVYLNDEDVRYMQKEATPVKENDNISIVPSIAGGRSPIIMRSHRYFCLCSYPRMCRSGACCSR